MANSIFVNLPVKDLDVARNFWTKVGYSFNPQFTDENATCLVLNEQQGIFAMLLRHEFFNTFQSSQIADPGQHREVIFALGVESRERVDEVVDNAAGAGGEAEQPKDEGFMYSRAFTDPDGHLWEVLWMDPNAVPPQES